MLINHLRALEVCAPLPMFTKYWRALQLLPVYRLKPCAPSSTRQYQYIYIYWLHLCVHIYACKFTQLWLGASGVGYACCQPAYQQGHRPAMRHHIGTYGLLVSPWAAVPRRVPFQKPNDIEPC